MRLIDADAYLYKGDLINEPTIDAEPVKHGHWIKEKYERPICSVCGNEGFLSILDSITGDFPYCAWCGAKMDEEAEDGQH